MQIGETVVLVQDLDGMPAGKEGRVMRVRGDMRLIGCRAAPEMDAVTARVAASRQMTQFLTASQNTNKAACWLASNYTRGDN